MNKHEAKAKEIVDTYINGYSVNNTPKLIKAIAQALSEAESAQEIPSDAEPKEAALGSNRICPACGETIERRRA